MATVRRVSEWDSQFALVLSAKDLLCEKKEVKAWLITLYLRISQSRVSAR